MRVVYSPRARLRLRELRAQLSTDYGPETAEKVLLDLMVVGVHYVIAFFKLCTLIIYLDIHIADRLAVLDICLISACTAKNNYLKNILHLLFKVLIYPFFLDFWEVAKMNGHRCSLVKIHNKVLIYILRNKRYHRGCCLTKRNKCSIKSHIRIYLILWHILCPITLTATSYIPVTQIINKF